MAQLNDLLVLGKSYFGGAIKANSDHDLLAHSNEFNFASPKFSGDIYVNYRTASGSDGNIENYRFCKGAGNTLSNIYASTFYGALSGNATTATGFASAKTIALTGDVTGSVAGGNGSNGWSIATTVASVPNAALPRRIQNYSTSGYDDANDATEQGFHYMTTTATNRPSFVGNTTNKDYRILTTAYSSSWVQQIATDFRCNEIYYRRRENGTWKSWVEIPTFDNVIDNTAVGPSGWVSGTAKRQLINHNTLAYWNGAYAGTSSNLAYCKLGAFGTMATQTATDYLARSGGTMTGDITLNNSNVNIVRAGISQSWYQGRNSAMIKTTSYSGYDAILSMKTTAGDWALGVYNDNKLYFTYILDSNYNTNANTTTAQIRFDPDGNIAATKFSGSGAGLTSLNASNISTGTLAAARLPNHASTATTYGVGDANNYGHVILYPAASCTSYTSDSGGACTPAAVKKAVELFGGGGAIIYKVGE